VTDTSIRLQKHLARAGIASRRHAEALIAEGRVRVNGQVVKTLGTKVDPERDAVTVDGQTIADAEAKATILLSKPDGVMTTMSDPEGRRTVAGVVAAEPFRLVPVGRLDFHTEGALLMTTDGELAYRLLHPSYKVPKVYLVKVGGIPSEAKLDRLRSGIMLEDGPTQPALVDKIEVGEKHTWLEFILTEGRQRQVRRMCEAIEHRPLRVVRTTFATLRTDGLRPGQYRYLTKRELDGIYGQVGLPVPPLPDRARELGGQPQGEGERGRGPLPGEEDPLATTPHRAARREARRVRGPVDAPRRRAGEGAPRRRRDEIAPRARGDEAAPRRRGDEVAPRARGDEAAPRRRGDEGGPPRSEARTARPAARRVDREARDEARANAGRAGADRAGARAFRARAATLETPEPRAPGRDDDARRAPPRGRDAGEPRRAPPRGRDAGEPRRAPPRGRDADEAPRGRADGPRPSDRGPRPGPGAGGPRRAPRR
jgi:pseudouridine synthase